MITMTRMNMMNFIADHLHKLSTRVQYLRSTNKVHKITPRIKEVI